MRVRVSLDFDILDGDHHQEMNSVVFLEWFENIIILEDGQYSAFSLDLQM
jgi:hypothetical protein